MKLTIARIISFIAGLFCIIAGLYVLVRPVQTAAQLSYTFQSISGLSEFIVFYGGFSIGMGAFFLAGAIVKRYLESSLLFLAISSLAAALARIVILAGNQMETLFFLFLAGESLLFLLGMWGVLICRKHFGKAKK